MTRDEDEWIDLMVVAMLTPPRWIPVDLYFVTICCHFWLNQRKMKRGYNFLL